MPPFGKILLSWKGSFIGKEQRIAWRPGPLCILLSVWKATNSIVFTDDVLSSQKVKSYFAYLSKTKLSMVCGPSTLDHFIDWLALDETG